MSEYVQAWKRYRRLVIYWVALGIAFVPLMLTFGILSKKLFRSDALFPYLVGLWFIVWFVSYMRICAFKCPRCGETFIGDWGASRNVFLFRKCTFCDLPRHPDALSVFHSP